MTTKRRTDLALSNLQRRFRTKAGGNLWPDIQAHLIALVRRAESNQLCDNTKELLVEIIQRSEPVRKAKRPPDHDWFEVGSEVHHRHSLLNAIGGKTTITKAREMAVRKFGLPIRTVTRLHKQYVKWEKDAESAETEGDHVFIIGLGTKTKG